MLRAFEDEAEDYVSGGHLFVNFLLFWYDSDGPSSLEQTDDIYTTTNF